MTVNNYERNYGGMIWTNHALDRLKWRKINQVDALAVIRNPEKTFPGKNSESVKFIRTINGREIHLVAVMMPEKKWLVKSVWVRGEEDQYGFPEKYVYWLVDWVVRKISWWWRRRVRRRK